MGDLISRQAAIDAISKAIPSLTTPDGSGEFDHEIYIAAEAYADAAQIIHDLPSVQPEWISCNNPPEDGRSVFIVYGRPDFKTCCIGYYDPGQRIWYEDRNWFASPIYDCLYWCDIPDMPGQYVEEK